MAQLLVVILNDSDHLPALLDAWQDIGIPGATILDSTGAHQAKSWLHRFGLSAVSGLLSASEVKNKTLFAVIDDDDLLEKAIVATEEIIGDFSLPYKGLLFVVPITQARGLVKQAPESEAQPASPAKKPGATTTTGDVELITRNTLVSVVDEILNLRPAIVSADTDLMEAAEVLIENPDVNNLCVVDHQQRVVGLLPIQNLADDLFLQVIPEEFLSHTKDREDALHFADLSRTQTAGDAMIPIVSVKRDERVRDAFHKMHTHKLSGIPVVDEQNKITGYINLLELLALYCRSQGISPNKGT